MKTNSLKTLSILATLFTVLFVAYTSSFGATLTVMPSAVSNTYSGFITLLITNIPTRDSVVVQKFLDLNNNGVIDGNDWLVQQFTVTDGTNFIIGGVTNLSVPGDLNSATGAVTANLNFQAGDFSQNLVGTYLYKISSPAGHFTPVTNVFTVTNFPYPQGFTGTVVNSAGSAPVSNAVVILFPAPRSGNNGPGGNPVGGAVASLAGNYNILMPPGTYVPMALGSNYVADYSASPVVTLGSQTIHTNMALTIATSSISGRVVDIVNTNYGLPGVFEPLSSDSGQIAVGFTDTNGYFNIPVTAGSWNFGSDDSGLIVQGYVGYKNGISVNAGTTGVVSPFYKATAMFYGSVKDSAGNPLPGLDVSAYDNNNGEFQADAYSNPNGKYSLGVVGGLGNDDPWQVQISSDGGSGNPANYIFSQPDFDQNGGTNLAVGQALKVSFTAVLATNFITGNVQINGTDIVGLSVYASATINGVSYNAGGNTDANGDYSLQVANGTWSVGVNCNGGDNSLDNILGSDTYQCPNNQTVTINNSSSNVNFVVQSCAGVQIITTALSNGQTGTSYYTQLQAASCNDNLTWSVNDPADFPPGLTLDSSGEIFGTPSSPGVYNFSIHVNDNNGHTADTNLSLTITGTVSPLQVATTYLPVAVVGYGYTNDLAANGGVPAYNWSLTPGSLALPAGLNLAGSGAISGVPITSGTNDFSVRVTDTTASTADQLLEIIVYPTLLITNASLPNGTLSAPYSAQIGATGGRGGYFGWNISAGSLPNGLNINDGANFTGLISGTPTQTGTFPITVSAHDNSGYTVQKNFSITIGQSLAISTTSLSNATVGVAYTNQIQAIGGTTPYTWIIANGSQPLPAALTLSTSGLISGVPAASGTSYFIVRLTDSNALTTTKSLSLIVQPKPTLILSSWQTNRTTFRLTGMAGQNYTLQASTNLSLNIWFPLLVTNNATTNSFMVADPNATNQQRFYRVLIGP